jgi:hypothetical protein
MYSIVWKRDRRFKFVMRITISDEEFRRKEEIERHFREYGLA